MNLTPSKKIRNDQKETSELFHEKHPVTLDSLMFKDSSKLSPLVSCFDPKGPKLIDLFNQLQEDQELIPNHF